MWKYSGFLSGFFRLGCQKCIHRVQRNNFWFESVFQKRIVCLWFFLVYERKRFDFLATTFFGMVVKNVFYVSKISFRGKMKYFEKKLLFPKVFWTFWEEISDLWQNFYCMVFEIVFDMSKFFVETVFGFWYKNFGRLIKLFFPWFFKLSSTCTEECLEEKFLLTTDFLWSFSHFERFCQKKCRQCCQNCILRLQEKLWKQKFVLKKQFFIIFLGYERKLSGQLVKKLANFATTAFYVSRWTVWGIKKGKKKSIF